MSFSKMGRILPTSRDAHDQKEIIRQGYALVVAAALHDQLGDTHRAIKTIERWTGASERTVKNWLAGSSGPSGEHLVALARNSDEVFEAFLILSGRNVPETVTATTVSELRTTLQRAIALADVISVSKDQ
jgi:hypothetical protein